jgi:hypothetical protein
MDHNLKEIFERFAASGAFLNGEPYGSGHIHDTFRIETDRALCVIDLDTVMPGYIHYDFGDAIRTAANIAAEDEKELSKVSLDMDLFEAYASGYLSETRDTLNNVEKEYLAFAPRLITFTIAVRFLTDYLDGDNYFKVYHEHHNLQRAKAQMRLVESMEEQYDKMQKIIGRLV